MDDSLSELSALRTVVDAGGYRPAALRLGVSASALSAAVRRLEHRLGVRVLHRTTRSQSLTEAGRALLERASPALAEIEAALRAAEAFGDAPRGRLRLNVPTVVADVVMPALLAGFLARYPNVSVDLVAQDDFIDVLAAGFDAGVRYGERLAQDVIAVPIGPKRQRYVTAAAPALLAAYGPVLSPQDLVAAPAIRYRFASGAMAEWEFDRKGETVRIAPSPRLTVGRMSAAIEAAVSGVVFMQSFEEYLASALASGALVEVLPEWSEPFPGPLLYYSGRRHVPPSLRAFLDFARSASCLTLSTSS